MRTRSAARLAAAGDGQASHPGGLLGAGEAITRGSVSVMRRRKKASRVESPIVDSTSDDPDNTLPAPRLKSRSRSPTKRSTMRICTSASDSGRSQRAEDDASSVASGRTNYEDENPDPEMYETRTGIFDEEKEREERFGIVESPWFPLRSQSLGMGPFKARTLRDLDGFLFLWFVFCFVFFCFVWGVFW